MLTRKRSPFKLLQLCRKQARITDKYLFPVLKESGALREGFLILFLKMRRVGQTSKL